MFCPVCKAEYRESFTVCSDCEVALIPALPAAPGETEDDPFCAFWKGDDPRVHAELCALLDEQGIPFKTVHREDHLFNLNWKNALQIGIPASLFEKAEAAVKEAFGTGEETGADAVATLHPPELPAPDEAESPPDDWDPGNWDPEAATVEVWSGDRRELADMLGASLAENYIHFRWEGEDPAPKLFVRPQEEDRAREIVREILEGTPPA